MTPKLSLNLKVFIFFGIITFLYFFPLFTHLNSSLMFEADDGIKNIYTYLYHAMYGHGLWYEGSNYPFGEHVTFTDNQPLLAVGMAYLRDYGIVSGKYALGVFNFLIPLSVFLGLVYLYKILREYSLPVVYAFIVSLLIIGLSPQWIRFNSGHFGLMYMHYLPMQFYWLKKYYDLRKIKYVYFIAALAIIMPFLHMYFLAFFLLWVGAFCVSYLVIEKRLNKKEIRFLAPLLLTCLVTFLITFFFVKLSDPITDRPLEPYGLFKSKYFTGISDIFAQTYTPFWDSVMFVFPEKFTSGEGNCYPGMLSLGLIFFISLWWLRNKLKKKKPALPFKTGFRTIWIYSALLLLLFASGIPFIWGLESLLELIAPLKQFRTFGRFSWGFYYIITIYSALLFWKFIEHLKSINKNLLANITLVLGISIWLIEAGGFMKFIHHHVTEGPNKFREIMGMNPNKSLVNFLDNKEYAPEDFQAILFLPYTNTGSEKITYYKQAKNGVTLLLSSYSLQMQIPHVNVRLSRTSWTQTFSQITWASGKWASKPCLDQYNSKKVLIVCDKNEVLSDDELFIVNESNFIGILGKQKLYALDPNKLKETILNQQNYIRNKYSEIELNKISEDSLSSLIRWPKFAEKNPNAKPYFYYRAAKLDTKTMDNKVIDSIPIPFEFVGKELDFSIWAKVPRDNYRSPSFKIKEYDELSNIISETLVNSRLSNETIYTTEALWFRYGGSFYPKNRTKLIKIEIVNDEGRNSEAVQQLLLREKNILFLDKIQNGLYINNHLIGD